MSNLFQSLIPSRQPNPTSQPLYPHLPQIAQSGANWVSSHLPHGGISSGNGMSQPSTGAAPGQMGQYGQPSQVEQTSQMGQVSQMGQQNMWNNINPQQMTSSQQSQYGGGSGSGTYGGVSGGQGGMITTTTTGTGTGGMTTTTGMSYGGMIQSGNTTNSVTNWSTYQHSSSQLIPQPLEIVGKDEDPVYGPLSRARGKVERALNGDNEISPDLGDCLDRNNPEPYVPPPGGSNAFRPIRITKTTPLPDALHQELNYKHLTAKMGLFEELERAWFTVDNKLFLWNYNDGRDFSRYDEQSETIEAVALVKARKDVFVDDITHVLLICTSSRATLLGLSRSPQGELSLYQTSLTVDTPTTMVSIHGSDSGRIFMLGLNRDLYELEYSGEGGWFFGSSTRVILHNRTSGALSNWVPTFLSSQNREGIQSFVIDAPQNRLFTLHTTGVIDQYDISGSNFILKSKFLTLKRDLQSRGTPLSSRIVGIFVVGSHESRRVGLMAVADNVIVKRSTTKLTGYLGVRVYFTVYPSGFGPVFYRFPPQHLQLRLADHSFYSSGTFIGVQHPTSSPTPVSQLTFFVPNPGRQSSGRENFENYEPSVLQEWPVQDEISSQVWTIVEAHSTNPAFSPPSLRRTDGIAVSPLPRQSTTEARQFLILATSGLFWAVQPRPVDMLQSSLDSEKDAGVNIARMTFGKNQLGAMGIMLGSQADLKQSDLHSSVNSILLQAGQPLIKDGTTGRSIVYSSRHDGLALILARFLRPIWNLRVTVSVMGRQVLNVPESQLLVVQGRLDQLRRYIEEHPFPRHQAEGDAKLAWDQEELSLHGMGVLVKQAVEAISFVLLLADYKISDVIARCDAQLQSTLLNLTYQGLLTSLDGREVARKLVTALIEQQIGQELGIDSLSEILQQRCGTFCQPGDVVLYKAEENIRRAESSRDVQERFEALVESLRLFNKAASSIPTSRLKDISARYRAMQYTPGAVELPLNCAANADPHDRAREYVRDGRHPADPRKAMYDLRMECYGLVVAALGAYDEMLDESTARGDATGAASAGQKRNEAYAMAIASDDELFHFYLYDWHVVRGLHEQLLEFDTPYIEEYLRTTSSDLEDRRDLLWKFYARREEWLSAAHALHNLATRPSPMSLQTRLAYLAQSLTSAKSAVSLTSPDVEFINSLSDLLEVTQVQLEILHSIHSLPISTDPNVQTALDELNSSLLGLDELWHKYAAPYRLLESLLAILKVSDNRVDDVCEAVWNQLIEGCEEPKDVSVSEKIIDLCRRFYPSEAAPLDIILPIIYSQCALISSAEGMATLALLDGGIPLRDIWETLRILTEQAEDEIAHTYLAEESYLLQKWKDTLLLIC
ncbi:hypothetical protein TREMEDRAFT_63207 [Tremella mesenterica DSM 1558]|uniref:uncharacterized protein n=1 Tax=Tremella mesenterica (strain ATCC 24925 / CBS 8224 / DSM 1558 / NBRC 9311 / NRRL Y-6157 / RJB 2259-6 / UBC 559-6) TaxID=578456 RepID=UPI0003F4A362|nr:uncharacterized protein TREMEDRAFT_63207 [Tremella mesenterica DSM 1558]EIW68747.1 hypothetical protein TREMEDRAFT_63207 [Tremella mesenterica DSM 1558]